MIKCEYCQQMNENELECRKCGAPLQNNENMKHYPLSLNPTTQAFTCGHVQAGRLYIIGEHGNELFIRE